MSTIDERIVSMKFDNRQFQSGVSESLDSINKLKTGLKFEGATKGLDGISESTKRVNFDGLTNGLESVRVKFSALQVVAVTALSNITNSIINTGKQMVSSLTTEPIMDGFREYETQMNAIQTVLANTSSKGTTLKEVNAALAELNTYSDKTIYNFTEMSKNIGTFTAAGVDLKTSVSAIKGIANLAAVSGSSSEQASTAMYQLSQALAAGTVKLQDWNSVVNAGMGGEVFQNALKETARVHGVQVDAIIKKEGSFRDSLQKGWLTTNILTETLNKFTGDLNEKQLKSMGYTDKQIAGIIKMGQTANDAATKVKTFSQLMDTLKEAVGSGWAQTWQTIFGDFDEAKVLFTNVSNTLGGMINASSTARNKLLSGWKDLGGRTALINAIKNAFDGVMGVVKSVGDAFREIFPPTTSAQLFNFTKGLENLSKHLILSKTTLEDIKSTFKGVFAVLDIGKTIFLAVANAIKIMLGGVNNLGSGIFGITGSMGKWLVSLDETIKKSGIITNVLSTVAYKIRDVLGIIAFVFNTIVDGAKKVGTAIGDYFSNFKGLEDFHALLGLIERRMSSIGDDANGMVMTVGGAFIKLGMIIANSKIGALFIGIYNVVKMVAKAVGVLVGKLADTISNSIKNADFSSILDGISAISIGGMLLAFKKFMTSLKDITGEGKGVFGNIKGVLNDVRSSFEAYQQNLKAGVLIKLGVAISLLAASIVAISLIDSSKLASSLAAIGVLFTQLLVAMKVYSMIGEFKGKVLKASVVMLSMSTSILILSGAMKKLAELNWNGLAKGLVGVAGLAAILVGAAKILSMGEKTIVRGSAGMVIFAAAIKVLASACADLSKLSWEGIAKGLVGVGILMTTISLFLNNTKFSIRAGITATGIIILAAAIKILASACSDFGRMSWETIGKGLASIAGLLTEITLFTKFTGNAKHVISTGIALVAIGAAMKILASAMKDFGSMSWESIGKGLVIIGGALTEIAIAVRFLPADLIVTASGLVIMATALKILSSVLIKMGGMSWESIAKGLVTLGGSLTILSIGLYAMKGSIAGSAALLIAAGALAVLTPVLTVLGAMPWMNIVKGLAAIAGVIAILGIASAVLTPVIPSMLGLAGALVLLGVSMVGIGAGLTLVGLGISAISAGLLALSGITAVAASAIVASLSIIIVGIAALIPTILAKVGEGILACIKVFSDNIPAILQCVVTILMAILDTIVANTPKILNGVFTILSQLLAALVTWTPVILQQVLNIIFAILDVVAKNIGRFVEKGVDIAVAFITGIANSIGRVIDSAFKLVISFINGLADAIRKNSGAIADACYNLITAVVDSLGSFNGRMVDAGINAVKGFAKGLASIPGKIWDAGKALGKSALDAARNALDEHSPSKEFHKIGAYGGEGFANGLNSWGSRVSDISSNIGNKALNSMSNAISSISDIVSDNIGGDPIIRPVLDLTNIQNGSKQLYSMMDNIGNYNVNGSVSTANQTANSIRRSQVISDVGNITKKSNNIANSSINSTPKPAVLQLVLGNGKAIAEYIVDDLDSIMGNKNKITGRMVGL
jgi:tape measure domain-containing protein